MDIRWKRYSYSLTAKMIAFLIAVTGFTNAVLVFMNMVVVQHVDLDDAYAESYYLSTDYIQESKDIVEILKSAIKRYKSEEFILNGGTVTSEKIREEENRLFTDFKYNSKRYNHNLNTAENYQIFQDVYADKIAAIKPKLIDQDLNEYRAALNRLNRYEGVIYFAKSTDTVLSNTPAQTKEHFKTYRSYMIFDGQEQSVFPVEIKNNRRYHWFFPITDELNFQDVIYVAYTDEFLNPRTAEWEKNRNIILAGFSQMSWSVIALVVTLIFLFFVVGRNPDDKKIKLNSVDKIYTDINLALCFLLILSWCGIMVISGFRMNELNFPITLLIAALGLILILSLVKHIKNSTFIKHSFLYIILNKIYQFFREVYNTGSTSVKIIIIVIGYPILVAITIFMFPITIGAAAWLALQKVKEFNAIREGVKKVKEGDLNYSIDIKGDGELAKLAADINHITDGLNKAVESEIRSERLKSELITNVSHDIRTPLTSIITYIDLLKKEKDEAKAKEYQEIIEQKAQRLKVLTDDLFEAAKASSGNMPVNLEKIDLVSLLTQGLGEMDDKIKSRRLEFRFNHGKDKVFVEADGKLLWRAIENLLLNILKYALEGSRVYIDIIDSSSQVTLTLKNISAFELNISAEELMERFKRGDESRTSQGSGLGLSIAKSLIEIQRGNFNIEIDGDLFKAVIKLNK